MEPALPCSHAQQAPGGGGGHGPGLLVTGCRGGFPGVAPGGEAAEDIRFEFHDDARAEHRAAADQGQRGKIAGAEVCDDQEGHKENRGGPEVTHQAQQADAYTGQNNEQRDVPLVEQPLQRSGTGKNIAQLGDFRGLEGQRPQGDPVHSAVLGTAKHQRDAQQADGCRSHKPAGPPHPVQVPQEQSQHQKQHQSQQYSTKLLEKAPRRAGSGHRQGQRGEEKRDGLHLKPHAAGTAEHGNIQPHHHCQSQKSQGQHHSCLRPGGGNELQAGQYLEHRQPQKRGPHGGGPLRPALLLQRLPFRYGLGQKHQGYAAQGDGIPHLHRGGALHRLPVDQGAALGAQVVDRPLPFLAPAQGRMLAGDAGIVQKHIAVLPPADDVLPVGQEHRCTVGQAQLAPGLRGVGDLQKRAHCPEQDQDGQYRKDKADERRVPRHRYGVCREKARHGIQCRLERRHHLFHDIRLLFFEVMQVYHFFLRVYRL